MIPDPVDPFVIPAPERSEGTPIEWDAAIAKAGDVPVEDDQPSVIAH